MATIERILGNDTGKVGFEKTDRNMVKVNDELVAHKAENVQQEDTPHGIIYEEGIWTPKFNTDNITFASQYGKYIRYNSLIWLHLMLKINEINEPDDSLSIDLAGFPFAPSDDSNDRVLGTISNQSAIGEYEDGYDKLTIVGNSDVNMFFDDTRGIKSRNQVRVRHLKSGGLLGCTFVYKIGG